MKIYQVIGCQDMSIPCGHFTDSAEGALAICKEVIKNIDAEPEEEKELLKNLPTIDQINQLKPDNGDEPDSEIYYPKAEEMGEMSDLRIVCHELHNLNQSKKKMNRC